MTDEHMLHHADNLSGIMDCRWTRCHLDASGVPDAFIIPARSPRPIPRISSLLFEALHDTKTQSDRSGAVALQKH